MKIRRIKQEDNTGCGLACIAMLARTDYKEVREKAIEFGIRRNGKFYTNTRDLHKLGQAFDVKTNQRRVRCVDKRIKERPDTKARFVLPDTAILAINERNDGVWHWVVYRRTPRDEYFLDPRSKREERRDFGRIRIESYIKVG